ncbi:glutathione S-transferase [Alkalicaulis satelles]|uniref:Glutathione S-transferase n=1 Tax=Alkalicaulis satelles TaxID=2609175 RepID=A0A5M6ZL29_9PROT|nr:glutathione S-transferase N-terminal domain-containing protein [Alkalicaulis satelles]KAA5804454.1 glutathione S-transferase [Alkalicaulis satelles]
MKLYVSPTSPYARKCRALIIEKSLENQVSIVECAPLDDPADLLAHNPLGKVPVLARERGPALMDSPLICEYLDSLTAENWVPARGESRFAVLRQQALADGLIDLVIGRRIEQGRDAKLRWPFWSERWERAVARTLETLTAERAQYERSVDLGALSVAAALGYMDLRYAEYGWRERHPELAGFAERWFARDSFIQTAPPQGA